MNPIIVLLIGATLVAQNCAVLYNGMSNSRPPYSISTRQDAYTLAANEEKEISFSSPWDILSSQWSWFADRKYVGSGFVYSLQTATNYKIQGKCRLRCFFNRDSFGFYFSSTGAWNFRKYDCDDRSFDISSTSNKLVAVLYPIQRFGQGFKCNLKSVPTDDGTPDPDGPDTNDCACGQRNTRSDRIVNGEETDPNEYPFYAALTRYGGTQVFCGGSIIAKKWIMTAAHCVDFISDNSNYEVDVGSHSRNSASPYQKTHKIKRIIIHPQWDSNTIDNDIALIELTKEISYNSKVGPVCLPFNVDYRNLDQKPSIVMGYGTIKSNGPTTSTLHDVTLSIESRADCRNYNNYYKSRITGNMLCTYTSKKDACQGDSGGPLVYSTGGKLVQIGVVSWGRGCAEDDNPGVYSYVRNYLDSNWIQDQTAETFCQE